MAALPSGTVTFRFTDIEGSTARWERYPEAMQVALARHDVLIRAAIRQHDGRVVKTMGDAFHAAFARATDAVGAALDAQRRLQAEPWGEIGPIRVRMALHTGTAEERDGDYYGPPLNRAARLLSAAHGGQILLSEVVSAWSASRSLRASACSIWGAIDSRISPSRSVSPRLSSRICPRTSRLSPLSTLARTTSRPIRPPCWGESTSWPTCEICSPRVSAS